MLLGSFGPWVSTFSGSVAGTDGSNDGWVVVAVAVIALALVIATRRYRAAGLWAVIGGVIGAAVTIHDRSKVSHVLNGGGAFVRALVQVGWGLNLAMVASILFAICGIAWMLAVETDPRLLDKARELPPVPGAPDPG